MRALRGGLGVVLSILMAGCAADGVTGTQTSTPSPSESTTEPKPTPSSPENGIPADLTLPGQADGDAEPRTDAGRLYDYICLDPEQQWTLGTGFVEAQVVVRPSSTRNASATIEKLAVYPSEETAVKAVRGLRTQVDLCGDGVDHVGNPKTWRSTRLTSLPAADEAVQLTYRSEGVVSTVVTVARVGRAVFYIDRREQYVDGVAQDERRVAEFVPTLAKAFR